jgi:DNA-binding transcriptional LysR family regulator
MEHNELKTFVAVAKTESFSQAAEQLFLSQPAISKRIASLESNLETKLFDRIGHKVSLTEYGRALLPRAQAILLELEDIRKSIKNLSGVVSGDLLLGASHHVGLRRLPPVLKQFAKNYPEANLDISFVDSEQAHDAVLRGEIELAIVTLPDISNSQLQTLKIWDDRLHIVVAKDHKLAKQNVIELKDLSKFKAILPSEKTFTRRIIEDKFRQENIPINIAMNTNYIETIRMMVSIGMGWSALPETMIDQDLKVLAIKDLNIHRSLGCIYHQDRTLSNAASAFLKLLQDTID